MGYNAEMFNELRGLGLKPGFRVIDLGSQDLFVGSDQELALINGFVASLGGIPFDEHSLVDKPVEAKTVFERAGLEYFRADVDERPSTIYVDFNKLVFPAVMRDTVDLVVNIGTTEHLSNPIGAFVFVSPFDAVLPLSDGEKEANLLWGALYPFMKTGVWTRKEINSTIDDFFSMVGKSFRTRRSRLQLFINTMKAAARPLWK